MSLHASQNTFFAQCYIRSLSEFVCYNKTIAMHCNTSKILGIHSTLYKVPSSLIAVKN